MEGKNAEIMNTTFTILSISHLTPKHPAPENIGKILHPICNMLNIRHL